MPLLLLLAAACQDASGSGRPGVAYLRIAAMDGPCTATQPISGVPRLCPIDNLRCAVDKMLDLPFTRAQATVAFEAASQWPGGNLVAVAWQGADGSIGRLQIDLGPNRGYGLSHFPYPSPAVPSGQTFGGMAPPPDGVQQAIGYVEWQGSERRFAATSVTSGLINYGGLFVAGSVMPDPRAMYVHVAFDGVGPNGEAKCRVIGMHVSGDYDRFNAYDPSWLEPDPGILLGNDRVWPPSFAGDKAPTVATLAPAAAPADPGGVAPPMPMMASYATGYFYAVPGSSGGGGGGGGDA